jgi:hypothetical protein
MTNSENDEPAPRRRRRNASPVTVLRAVSSQPARTAYVVLGTLGLVALAVAVVGPRRMRHEILEPLRDAIEPHAEKAWAEAAPLRDQIASLFDRVSPDGKKQLARNFQGWVGHFGAG